MDIIIDVIKDSWLMLPLLYVTYCFLEVFERKESDDRMFFSLQKYGPILGAVLGLIPQCGFSILAAMLYLQNNITLGTLIAVMIATSDEAIPVLICNLAMIPSLIVLMISKFVIAIIVGYLVDYLIFPKQKIQYFSDMEDEDDDADDAPYVHLVRLYAAGGPDLVLDLQQRAGRNPGSAHEHLDQKAAGKVSKQIRRRKNIHEVS